MVITGDLSQIDLPPGQRSGLRDALDTVEGLPTIGITRFGVRDVVRHPLVAAIVNAYEQRAQAQRDAGVPEVGQNGPRSNPRPRREPPADHQDTNGT